jgi:hypothetical protein
VNRFLVVGCGGSGGATLQFLMDQLRAELVQHGIDELPRGWQFIHVDVPTVPDGVGPDLPASVPAQGGQYVAMAARGATYPDIAATVDDRLRERDALGELATWRPRPEEVNFPIQDGAGQYRAVGRILTLVRAQQVRAALESAWQALQGAGPEDELRRVADLFSPATSDQVGRPPRILVVSSMAGGSGASMALDVCRLLTTIRNVDSGQILLMLYTAEVFGDLAEFRRAGVEANAAAMIGELMATQTGAAAESDRTLLAAFGVDASAADQAPFRRVIPIGRRIGGDGALFGDGTRNGIYRGIGRGLSALMLSGVATAQLQKAAIENFGAGVSVDRSVLGWGVDPDRLVWGSFGFASVGLGRDRYAEFAAQRIARSAVERLLRGHLTIDDRPSTEQLAVLLERVLWPRFSQVVDLPADTTPIACRQWVVRGLETRGYRPTAERIVRDVLGRGLESAAEHDVRDWLTIVERSARDRSPELLARIDEVVNTWALEWAFQTRDEISAAMMQIISTHGLPAARAALGRLAEELPIWARELKPGTQAADAEIAALPSDLRSRLTQLKGRVLAGAGPVADLLDGHRVTVQRVMGARYVAAVVDLLGDLGTGVVEPLRDACQNAYEALADDTSRVRSAPGRALLRTDEFAAWPSGQGPVPDRFGVAHNEILLSSVTGFEDEFSAHVRKCVGDVPFDDALAAVGTAVLEGRWPVGGATAEHPVLELSSDWWPARFLTDPREPAGSRTRSPRRGRYRLALDAAQVLERARWYVARRNEPFDEFVSQPLSAFLNDQSVGEAERRSREREVQAAFAKALQLSRPLVGVSARAVETIHHRELKYFHSFSDIPFSNSRLGTLLLAGLEQDPEEMAESIGAFTDALHAGQRSTANRIDIFGSTENFSPAVFTSLLEPVWRRWSSSPDAARRQFWHWRRTRRLPGAIPAGDAQRRAMMAGWYAGRLLGLVRYPSAANGPAFSVYSLRDKIWLPFPHPLLTSVDHQRHTGVRLAAVLESMSIALAASHASARLEPLRAYEALRAIWDDGRYDPTEPGTGTGVERLLLDWVQQGRTASGDYGDADLAGDRNGSPADRRRTLVATCVDLRESVEPYLPPGKWTSPGAGEHGSFHTGRQTSDASLFHEIAPDVHDMLTELLAAVDRTPESAASTETRADRIQEF